MGWAGVGYKYKSCIREICYIQPTFKVVEREGVSTKCRRERWGEPNVTKETPSLSQ